MQVCQNEPAIINEHNTVPVYVLLDSVMYLGQKVKIKTKTFGIGKKEKENRKFSPLFDFQRPNNSSERVLVC